MRECSEVGGPRGGGAAHPFSRLAVLVPASDAEAVVVRGHPKVHAGGDNCPAIGREAVAGSQVGRNDPFAILEKDVLDPGHGQDVPVHRAPPVRPLIHPPTQREECSEESEDCYDGHQPLQAGAARQQGERTGGLLARPGWCYLVDHDLKGA
ncbi:hypothetical protein GCM10027601_31060 [Nocardioides ungokensis]